MWTDRCRKAQQWSFAIPSFTKALFDHLPTLIDRTKVLYITFTICDDDTGNQFLLGFIKFHKRSRLSEVGRLIGPSSPETCTKVKPILLKIQMNTSFQELGKDKRPEAFRALISNVRAMTNEGVTLDKLLSLHMEVCSENLRAVMKRPSLDETPRPLLPQIADANNEHSSTNPLP